MSTPQSCKKRIAEAIKKGVESVSKSNELINIPATIQPMEPNRRILENSLVGLARFSKEMELHSDIVGMKQML